MATLLPYTELRAIVPHPRVKCQSTWVASAVGRSRQLGQLPFTFLLPSIHTPVCSLVIPYDANSPLDAQRHYTQVLFANHISF